SALNRMLSRCLPGSYTRSSLSGEGLLQRRGAARLLPAIGAEEKRRQQLMLARCAMARVQFFKRNHAQYLIQRREPLAQSLERIFLHQLHAVLPRRGANLVVAAAGANRCADRLVEHQYFVNSYAPLITGQIAF